jgi:hypothetical protein
MWLFIPIYPAPGPLTSPFPQPSGAYHQPRSFSTYTHPVPGYDHVLHEQQGVVPTGPRYEHAPAAPMQPYSTSYDHAAAQPPQTQYYAASPQVKTEDDHPTLYGEDGLYNYALAPAPASWEHHAPTRPVTPQSAHSEYSFSGSFSGSGSSFASSLSTASWRPSTESSLSMALVHPTSVSAPPLTRFKTEEFDNQPFLPQPEPSASPSPGPSTPVASGSASRSRRSKIPPKHVHRPLACHACRTRKIACLAPTNPAASGVAPGVCGPCARRGRECVFPAENGRGKHKVAQKQARLAREAEQRALCKREWP